LRLSLLVQRKDATAILRMVAETTLKAPPQVNATGIDLGITLEGDAHGDSPDGGGFPRAPSWSRLMRPSDTASGVRRYHEQMR